MTKKHSINPVDENMERVDEPIVVNGTEIGPNPNGLGGKRGPAWQGQDDAWMPLSDFHEGDGEGALFGNVVFALSEEEIVVVYRDDEVGDEGAGGHGGDGYLVQRRTTDGGETWSDRRTIFDTDGFSDRDPRGGMTSDGTLILFFFWSVIGPDTIQDGEFIRSTNGGRT